MTRFPLLFLLFPPLLALNAAAADSPFRAAALGCSMAHCDSQMSDQSGLAIPEGAVDIQFHDLLASGSGLGLGCSSNGTTAVCSYRSATGDAVIAYDSSGNRLWTSRRLLDYTAYTSVPIIAADGSVLTADRARLVKFSNTGKVLWMSFTPGGYPMSPVQIASGEAVLATANGPISVYDPQAGSLLATLNLRRDGTGGPSFDTANTPCVIGNRIYVSAQQVDDKRTGRLYAIDVDTSNPDQPLTVAWYWEFGGPSGASPTCTSNNTIIFDGYSPSPGGTKNPTLFAIHDEGTTPSLVWMQCVPNIIPASVAHDPREGVWTISSGYTRVERHSEQTGLVMDSFSLKDLIGDGNKYFPSSALTISGTPEQPRLTMGVIQSNGPKAYVIAVDLNTLSLLWKVELCPFDRASGQFPIVMNSQGQPVVVFSGFNTGAYFAGAH